MPCRCDPPESFDNGLSLEACEAALCGVLTALEADGKLQDTFDRVNWTEAGVRQENVERWWARHKESDAARKLAESVQRREDEKWRRRRALALAKLTPAERRSLGL